MSLAAVAAGGCGEEEAGPAATQTGLNQPLPQPEELLPRLEKIIRFTHQRHLDTEKNDAWQVLHGVVAYGPELEIVHQGAVVRALDWLLAGGNLKGWNMQPSERGIASIVEPGSASGQGHPDQWLGYMSLNELDWDAEVKLHSHPGQTYKIADLVQEAMWTCSDSKEMSWTLMAAARFLPRDPASPGGRGKLAAARWPAVDGTEWTVERMIGLEAAQDINRSACGGTHRLQGLTVALNRHLAEGGELAGGWLAARNTIDKAIADARQYQHPDGWLSSNYFERPGLSHDSTTRMRTVGHTFEFLVMAVDDATLREPWITRAAVRLCELFEATRTFDLECGALYHAAHGLVVYRDRLRQPASGGPPPPSPPAADQAAPPPDDTAVPVPPAPADGNTAPPPPGEAG